MNKNSTLIKICGLSRLEDIDVVNELLPDFIGFVFYEKSKRNVTKDVAKSLKEKLDSRIPAVGVFVDADPEFVISLLEEGIIDIAQLHGSEDEEYIQTIKTRTGRNVIKAFVVKDDQSLEEAEKSSADYLLLDSGMGTGSTFDWSRLDKVTRPYFLAGGLGPENIDKALSEIKPYAVDVSSGVETDGVKDPAKIREFINRIRSYS
jgi:phosphoribosylanthranilate isomerase